MSKQRALSAWQRMAYSIGNLGVGLMPSIIGSWALYYFSPPDLVEGGFSYVPRYVDQFFAWGLYYVAPPTLEDTCLISYVPVYLIGLVLAIGRVAEALINPFIGDWSDKTKTRWGRRIPYIIVGTPVMVLGMMCIWFPPVAHESLANAVWVAFWMTLISCAFALVVAPYLSLLPELTPHRDERVALSAYMALFEITGVLVATAGAGYFISAYKCGATFFGLVELNGFQLSGLIFGVLTLAVFWITGFGVKEKPYSDAKNVTMGFMDGAREVMRNHAFRPYLALVTTFRIGIDMVVVVIPYVVTVIMGGSEADAIGIQLVVMLGAVVMFPLVNWLCAKYGKKAVTVWGMAGFVVILPMVITIGQIPGLNPMLHGYLIFALATFPVAVVNITPRPLLADIIDFDETITKQRREAMFNGMEGLFTRSASGLAWVICSLLFAWFGKSVDQPLGVMLAGPVGGVFVLIGGIMFRKYPFKD
jgi:GPH family glycoside/pentoside/hexuronide:cation symporter